MSIEEFWKIVDDIDVDSREDGQYTRDELYSIGCAFIGLTGSQKREIGGWDKLVEVLHPVNRTGETLEKGETFRGWIKSQRKDKGELPSNGKTIAGDVINNISVEEFKQQTEELKQDLYKQQVKTRDYMNSYRRALREDARVEHINDLIVEAIGGLNKLPPVKIAENRGDEEVEAIMLFSDMHIGMQISNFFNNYNAEIARARVAKYVDETIAICKKNNVTRLNILNLGDNIHGNIHLEARIEATEDLVSQIILASEIIAEALNKLQEAAPEVIYRSCSDNHSRVTVNFKENIEKENYYRLIDFYLEGRLKGTNIQFAHDNLDVDLGFFKLLNGKNAAFAHGHRDNVNTALQSVLGATHQFCDYIFVGHWHESKMKSYQGAKVFVNSSICGPDSYAQSKRLYGDAEQTLLVFTGDTVSVNYINLNIFEP